MAMKWVFCALLGLTLAQEPPEELDVIRAMELYEDYELVAGNSTAKPWTVNATVGSPVNDQDLKVTPEPLPEPILYEEPVIVPIRSPTELTTADLFTSVSYIPQLSIDAKHDLERRKHQSLSGDNPTVGGRRYESPEIIDETVQATPTILVIPVVNNGFLWPKDLGLETPEFNTSDVEREGTQELVITDQYLLPITQLSDLAGSITDILEMGLRDTQSFLPV